MTDSESHYRRDLFHQLYVSLHVSRLDLRVRAGRACTRRRKLSEPRHGTLLLVLSSCVWMTAVDTHEHSNHDERSGHVTISVLGTGATGWIVDPSRRLWCTSARGSPALEIFRSSNSGLLEPEHPCPLLHFLGRKSRLGRYQRGVSMEKIDLRRFL